jgi:hypothetical protein
MEAHLPEPPSPSWGFRQAMRLWRLVVACWAVSVAAWLPAVWVVSGAVAPAVGNLPDEAAAIPQGDFELMLYQSIRGVAVPIELAVMSGFAIMWAWTILWHAGLVNWGLWAGGRRVRLGEVLGLGVVSWWRYACLSLTAAATIVLTLAATLLPLASEVDSALWESAESRVTSLLTIGVVVTVIVVMVVWASTARAAWLLGLPERRSIIFAWLLGLGGTLRSPLVSLGTVMVWAVPVGMVSILPLAVGFAMPSLRAGWVVPILGQLASAVCAFCWVGLFASFAPVTGLVGVEEEGEDNETRGPSLGQDDGRGRKVEKLRMREVE